MGTYYFVGSHCEIDGRIKLDKFGQRVQLDEEMAEIVIRGGGAILPEHTFEEMGFTDRELKDYAYPAARAAAPEEFRAKVKAAHVAFHDLKLAIEEASK